MLSICLFPVMPISTDSCRVCLLKYVALEANLIFVMFDNSYNIAKDMH